ncbi:ski-like protein isoform X3 [Callorhinchus milii]|uniref:ski-like protein isoform X3 n=1 Tax=Callorhinchus milii TaxID=7868 RepID=UPI00045761F5|nr:ski-like protein isoform X3 [Callorhinchus milii]|eukprot:gi/632934165/ref/XP_007901779.1/ PREDICTED: ski-like protein isoform X3 [Callorhinchus milii]
MTSIQGALRVEVGVTLVERMKKEPLSEEVMGERIFSKAGKELNGAKSEEILKASGIKQEGGEEFRVTEGIHTDVSKRCLISDVCPLDLKPGLKHTLAQFHLSSQSSLGGPAAFSARCPQDCMSPGGFAPMTSPPVLPGPLLIPSDSSTDLTHTSLEGETISCFVVGGEKRLCLPQVLNSVLRDFSLQQINTVCDELYIYCSRCTAEQLQILKVLGILPFNAPSCGLITQTDAQRLCNALIHPGILLSDANKLSGKTCLAQLQETVSSFEVEHRCLGKCHGLFVPQFYNHPEAACVQCLDCHMLFSPQKFVLHSHRSPDKRTCHWGFDSAKWRCYVQLGRKYSETPEEKFLQDLLEDIKEKFSFNNQRKRTLAKSVSEEFQPKKTRLVHSDSQDEMLEKSCDRKSDSQHSLTFHHWYPTIKQEVDHLTPQHASVIHPSCLLYMYDKVIAPNVSLAPPLQRCRDATRTVDKESMMGTNTVLEEEVKHRRENVNKKLISCAVLSPKEQRNILNINSYNPGVQAPQCTVNLEECIKSEYAEYTGEKDMQNVAMELSNNLSSTEREARNSHQLSCEEENEKIVEQIMKTYCKQQEKLNTTLQQKKHLQMQELKSLQSEHAQKMNEVQDEQVELEFRLEQLKQGCMCDHTLGRSQEAEYTAQLAELRQRLDRAEADRRELQEELRCEREAREKLEAMVKELKLQILETSENKGGLEVNAILE